MKFLSSAAAAAATATILFIMPLAIMAREEVVEVENVGDAIEMVLETAKLDHHSGDDRRQDRQTRRQDRRDGRQDRRVERRDDRQDRRVERRDGRQDRRQNRQDRRQSRRNDRRNRRSGNDSDNDNDDDLTIIVTEDDDEWWNNSETDDSVDNHHSRCRPISRTVVCRRQPPPYSVCQTTVGPLIVLNNYLTEAQGVKACCEMGYYPAGINSLNFVNASSLAYTCSGPGTGTWISSWNQDTYPGTCLVFNTAWTAGGGSINPASSCNDAKKVMCQLQPAPEQPLICNGIPPYTTSSTCTTSTRTRTCSSTSTTSSSHCSSSNIYSTTIVRATSLASITVTVSTSVWDTEYIKSTTQTAVTYKSQTTTISTPVTQTVTSTITPTSSSS